MLNAKPSMAGTRYDLEQRLPSFAVRVIQFSLCGSELVRDCPPLRASSLPETQANPWKASERLGVGAALCRDSGSPSLKIEDEVATRITKGATNRRQGGHVKRLWVHGKSRLGGRTNFVVFVAKPPVDSGIPSRHKAAPTAGLTRKNET
jgi:hypothetical protein